MCGFVTALLERKFYVIGFEYMLEVQKSGDDVEYMPVELGLVEWSMRSGISREFYRMINPGQLLFTAGDGRYCNSPKRYLDILMALLVLS